MDAAPLQWFSINDKFALHVSIDDTTGKILSLYIAKMNAFMVILKLLNNHH